MPRRLLRSAEPAERQLQRQIARHEDAERRRRDLAAEAGAQFVDGNLREQAGIHESRHQRRQHHRRRRREGPSYAAGAVAGHGRRHLPRKGHRQQRHDQGRRYGHERCPALDPRQVDDQGSEHEAERHHRSVDAHDPAAAPAGRHQVDPGLAGDPMDRAGEPDDETDRTPGVVVRHRREKQNAQCGNAQPEIDRSQRPQARDDARHQRSHQDDRDRQHGRVDADHHRVVAVARQRQRYQRHDGADGDADAERRSDDGRQTLFALGRGQRIRGHCL